MKRNVYRNNCGVLYPLDDLHELLKARVGDVCAAAKPEKDDFLAKMRLHRKRYGG